ncbi:MAG: peptide chain release factor N(5)-glutamine methyltransferase [Lachnospiraceae bacterium]|nr:peptide chain release factor N(5)-glutamine methyltransferase [Lachnospiraceae bacterium]
MKYAEMVKQGQIRLFKAGIMDADTDAWILLETICCVSQVDYFTRMHDEVPDDAMQAYFKAIDKRSTHYPLQYIIGEWEFMGLRFKVNESVLIPRQDTELIVETAMRIIEDFFNEQDRTLDVIDLCTGSGCIAISLAKKYENVNMVGTDISADALHLAKVNAELNKVDNVQFIKSDLFLEIEADFDSRHKEFDVIISNPPYIRSKEIEKLMPEVKDYEPRLALDGDNDGLIFYKKICAQSRGHLRKKGCLILEIGYDQADAVTAILEKNVYRDIQVIKDWSGNDRVVVAYR